MLLWDTDFHTQKKVSTPVGLSLSAVAGHPGAGHRAGLSRTAAGVFASVKLGNYLVPWRSRRVSVLEGAGTGFGSLELTSA